MRPCTGHGPLEIGPLQVQRLHRTAAAVPHRATSPETPSNPLQLLGSGHIRPPDQYQPPDRGRIEAQVLADVALCEASSCELADRVSHGQLLARPMYLGQDRVVEDAADRRSH